MSTLEFNIPTAAKNRIINGYCGHYNYQETVADPENEGQTIDNPETKQQFVKRNMIKALKDPVITYEMKQAREAETNTIKTDVEKVNIT